MSELEFEQSLQQKLIDLGWDEYGSDEIERLPDLFYINRKVLEESLLHINPDSLTTDFVSRIVKSPKTTSLGKDIWTKDSYWNIFANWQFSQLMRKPNSLDGLKLIDWETPINNKYGFVRQLTITGKSQIIRPDIILFVNGIPVAVIELKDTVQLLEMQHRDSTSSHRLEEATQQLRDYLSSSAKELWSFIQLAIIAEPDFACIGGFSDLSDPRRKTLPIWTRPGEDDSLSMEIWNPDTFLLLLETGVCWTEPPRKDSESGSTIPGQHFVARRHQFDALQIYIEKVNNLPSGIGIEQGLGTVWHTPGSGKTFTMAMFAEWFIRHKSTGDKHSMVMLLTDRLVLDEQCYDLLNAIKPTMFPEAIVDKADTSDSISARVTQNSKLVLCSTIGKLANVEDFDFNGPVLLLVDEAHRSYNNTAPGSYLSGLRRILPDRTVIVGFTGTPIESRERSTTSIFGPILHSYTLDEAVSHNNIVRIKYSRAKRSVLQASYENREAAALGNLAEDIIENDEYLNETAKLILDDWETQPKGFGFVGLVACRTRIEALRLYGALISQCSYLKPYDKIKLVYSSKESKAQLDESGSGEVDQYAIKHRSQYGVWKKELQTPHDRLDMGDSAIELVVLVDMWLTGFDAPRAQTLYLHKRLEDTAMIQTISRVNRRYPRKEFGRIVDLFGQSEQYDISLSRYRLTEDLSKQEVDRRTLIRKQVMALSAQVIIDLGLNPESFPFEDSDSRKKELRQSMDHASRLKNHTEGWYCRNSKCDYCRHLNPHSSFLQQVAAAYRHGLVLNSKVEDLVGIILILLKVIQIGESSTSPSLVSSNHIPKPEGHKSSNIGTLVLEGLISEHESESIDLSYMLKDIAIAQDILFLGNFRHELDRDPTSYAEQTDGLNSSKFANKYDLVQYLEEKLNQYGLQFPPEHRKILETLYGTVQNLTEILHHTIPLPDPDLANAANELEDLYYKLINFSEKTQNPVSSTEALESSDSAGSILRTKDANEAPSTPTPEIMEGKKSGIIPIDANMLTPLPRSTQSKKPEPQDTVANRIGDPETIKKLEQLRRFKDS